MFLAYLVRSSLVRFWVVESGPSQRRLWLGRGRDSWSSSPVLPLVLPPFTPLLLARRYAQTAPTTEPAATSQSRMPGTNRKPPRHKMATVHEKRGLSGSWNITCSFAYWLEERGRWGGKVWGAIRDSVFYVFLIGIHFFSRRLSSLWDKKASLELVRRSAEHVHMPCWPFYT